MACSAAISIFAVRQVLAVRLEERGKQILVREVEEFRKLRRECLAVSCKLSTNALLDSFLSRRIPADRKTGEREGVCCKPL